MMTDVSTVSMNAACWRLWASTTHWLRCHWNKDVLRAVASTFIQSRHLRVHNHKSQLVYNTITLNTSSDCELSRTHTDEQESLQKKSIAYDGENSQRDNNLLWWKDLVAVVDPGTPISFLFVRYRPSPLVLRMLRRRRCCWCHWRSQDFVLRGPENRVRDAFGVERGGAS